VTKNKSTSAVPHLSANGSLLSCYDSVMTKLLTPLGYLEAVSHCRRTEYVVFIHLKKFVKMHPNILVMGRNFLNWFLTGVLHIFLITLCIILFFGSVNLMEKVLDIFCQNMI